MKKLLEINQLYIKNKLAGYNCKESSRNAVDEVFGVNHSYINLNNYEESSHIFHKEYVLFFGNGIYKKTES
jgi:hypothetical protein